MVCCSWTNQREKIMPSLPAKPVSLKQCKKKQNPRNVTGMSLFDKARVEVLLQNITTVDKKDVDLRLNLIDEVFRWTERSVPSPK